MSDKIGVSNADKARLVWAEARVPKCGSLDDTALSALGHSLDWAHTWLETDSNMTAYRSADNETEHLEKIERTARELAGLLENDNGAVRRLGRFYPDFLANDAPPALSEMRRGIQAIAAAARGAATERKKISPVVSPKGVSPMDRYLFELMKIYEKYAGRKAGVCTGKDGKKDGPFPRFVQECARQYCTQRPSISAIEAAVRKAKPEKTKPNERHIIGLVKSQRR